MGFFRGAMSFFRSGARKHRDGEPGEILQEPADTATALPAVAGQGMKREEGSAGFSGQPAATVTTRLAVPAREVKREARPNPNKPGWGLSIGQEAGKAREDGASRE